MNSCSMWRNFIFDPVAQLVEQRPFKAKVRGSSPRWVTNLNAPTQSEQIVVSCLDWVGAFFACTPCGSRGTGFFYLRLHLSLAKGK